jgi:hypothetical protein
MLDGIMVDAPGKCKKKMTKRPGAGALTMDDGRAGRRPEAMAFAALREPAGGMRRASSLRGQLQAINAVGRCFRGAFLTLFVSFG